LDTEYLDSGVILRITPDGKRGFICQRTMYNGQDLCDVLIADLTMEKPMVTKVIKQVGDGLESFAFHPNGKMAVVTCLAPQKNALAVLDIEKGQFVLKERAPGVSIEKIKAATDGDLLIPDSVSEMDLD